MLPEVPRKITHKSVNLLHAHIKYSKFSFIGTPSKFVTFIRNGIP